MARIRTIKPEFPQSESIGKLSRAARLLFIQLWTVADDHGRCRAAPRLLAGQLYPYDDDAVTLIGDWIAELEQQGLAARYSVEGSQYLEIIGWAKHQRVDNAGKSNIPPRLAETRGEPPRDLDPSPRPLDPSPLDLGPRKGPRKGEDAREPPPLAEQTAPPARPLPSSHDNPAIDLRMKISRLYDEFRIQAPDTSLSAVWLEQGYAPALILAVIRSKLPGAAGKSLAWFTKAIQEAAAVKAPPPKPLAKPDEIQDHEWRFHLKRFRERGSDGWPPGKFGPEPGEPGCKVPSHILREFDLESAA